MKGAHLGVLHHTPLTLVQGAPRVSLETGRVGQRSNWELWELRSHHGRAQPSLCVQVEGVSRCTVQELELDPVGLIKEGSSGRILDQGKVIPGVVFLENRFTESDEKYDEGDNDEDHQRDAYQLLFVDHGVSCLHVWDEDTAQAAALAHEARRAVTVEGAMRVDAHAAVLTLTPRSHRLTLVDIVPTTAAEGGGDGGEDTSDSSSDQRLNHCPSPSGPN